MPDTNHTTIVDLDALIPNDLRFTYRGDYYEVPGDIPVATVYELFARYEQMAGLQKKLEAGKAPVGEGQKLIEETQALVLRILQVRQPELKESPFGMSAISIVVPKILELLGVVIGPGGAAVPPTPPKRAVPKSKTKSRRR